MELPFDIQDARPEIQARYRKLVEAGNSPRFAEMLALQAPPGVKGLDRAFMQGRMNNQQLDALPPVQAKWLAKEARAAGISIEGKFYCGGLADKRRWRDPEAWVSGVDDIKKVAQKRRLHVQGAVDYSPESAPPPKRTVMAEDLVRDRVKEYKKKFPGKKAGELREMVIEKHAWKPKEKSA
jgi:hypothetical protein